MERNNINKPNTQKASTSSQSSDTQKKQPSKKKKSGASVFISSISYIIFVLATSGILSYFAINISNDMFAFLKEDKEIVITLQEGATISDVSQILSENGIIENKWIFDTFVSITASESKFTEGTHHLNSNMDYRGLLNELRKSTVESIANTVRVTVPEGYTIDQMAVLFEENNVVGATEFLNAIETHDFDYEFIKDVPNSIYNIEGYLFPDTYEFYIDDNPVTVINKMLKNFENKIYSLNDEIEASNLSLHEIITIASLIEREAVKADEQGTISGVIHNRLKSSAYPFLNIDATIQYVAGHRENILQADLDKDGPYNTYTRQGLPPGPIASPGMGSIDAAVSPENHDYYFYVAKSDGYHIFTKNLTEHNAAVAQVRK